MSMPQIPEGKNRPSLKNTIIDLLESIALEEMALSHLVNAEAEKIQALTSNSVKYQNTANSNDILKFNQQSNQMIETIVMKEWLLLKKLDKITQLDFLQKDKQFEIEDEKLAYENNEIDENIYEEE